MREIFSHNQKVMTSFQKSCGMQIIYFLFHIWESIL